MKIETERMAETNKWRKRKEGKNMGGEIDKKCRKTLNEG
jgi:hypothetical protein